MRRVSQNQEGPFHGLGFRVSVRTENAKPFTGLLQLDHELRIVQALIEILVYISDPDPTQRI